VEADEGIAIIPLFGLPACRSRKIAMSELVNPTVNLDFYEISSCGKKLPEDAAEFSSFLKKYTCAVGRRSRRIAGELYYAILNR
jgi:hypothetical protein